MSNRTAIPKVVRFEVFKRDKFTCQYCGAKAPDVLLECDHIHPVADGGKNDILNLVTACKGCNSGKGVRLLSENAALEKQRAQLEELQLRREQLEMLIAWRDGLDRLSVDQMQFICDRIEWLSRGNTYPTEEGRDRLRRWIKRYGAEEVLTAIDDAFAIYMRFDGNEAIKESIDRAFQKIGWALWTNRQSIEKPYIKRLLYVQGICRNRFSEPRARYLEYLERFHLAGMSVEELEQFSKTSCSWAEFIALVRNWHRNHNPGDAEIFPEGV